MNLKHDKEKILLAGLDLIRAQGYNGTGINEILKKSGVSKGSFYNYFDSKESFMLEVIEVYGFGVQEIIKEALSSSVDTALDRIRSFAKTMFAFQEAENCVNGCLVYNLSFEIAGQKDRVASALQDQIDAWIDLIEPVIKEGQESGEIVDRFPPRDLALMIHTAINGAAGRMKIGRSIDPMSQMFDMTVELIQA